MHQDRPSSTAKLVANWLHFQLHESSTYHLGSDAWREWSARLLQASGMRGRAAEFLASAGLSHQLFQRVVPEFYQAFVMHLLFRKLWVERSTRRFLESMAVSTAPAGEARVIVVGAGLDTLAFRLAPEFPQVQFIEVDHPATQSLKRKALAEFERSKGDSGQAANVQLVAADLTQLPLSEALAAQGQSAYRESPTFVILEGLFMYLNRDIVQGLMHDLTHLSPSPRVAFTFLAPWRYSFLRQLVASASVAWLKVWREPFEWIVPPEDLKILLEEWGWSVDALRHTADVAQEDFDFSFSAPVAEQLCLVRYRGHG